MVYLVSQVAILVLSSQLSSGLCERVPAGCYNQSLETKEKRQDIRMRAHGRAKQSLTTREVLHEKIQKIRSNCEEEGTTGSSNRKLVSSLN